MEVQQQFPSKCGERKMRKNVESENFSLKFVGNPGFFLPGLI